MNTDFRIEVGFFDHHKTRRLIASLGLPAAWALLRLWEFATVNKPDGDLRGMTATDIAAACHYEGDPEAFVGGLVGLSLVDKGYSHGRPIFSLHDWSEHQPFVVNAPARRDKARKAAEARWKPASNKDARSNARGMPGASSEHARSNAPAFQPSNQEQENARARSNLPGLPFPTRSGGDRNQPRTGSMQRLGGAHVEPKGTRPKLSPADQEQIEKYRVRRNELEREFRAKHPSSTHSEILSLVSAQLRVEGLVS